jgi:hypothetical protein
MFDHKVRLLTEGLARAIGRRKFLTQMSAAVFASVATLAAGRGLSETVFAQQEDGEYDPVRDPRRGRPPNAPLGNPCNAPRLTFCSITGTVGSSDGCQGAYCFQHKYNNQILECQLSYNWGYSIGCWTSADTQNNGYWTCCDCDCGTPPYLSNDERSCGCARWSQFPMPATS